MFSGGSFSSGPGGAALLKYNCAIGSIIFKNEFCIYMKIALHSFDNLLNICFIPWNTTKSYGVSNNQLKFNFMKRSSFILAFSVLVHLLVIDLTFYFITSGTIMGNPLLISYNLIWLCVALMIGSQIYTEGRG